MEGSWGYSNRISSVLPTLIPLTFRSLQCYGMRCILEALILRYPGNDLFRDFLYYSRVLQKNQIIMLIKYEIWIIPCVFLACIFTFTSYIPCNTWYHKQVEKFSLFHRPRQMKVLKFIIPKLKKSIKFSNSCYHLRDDTLSIINVSLKWINISDSG